MSHAAVYNTLEAYQCPGGFIELIKYLNSNTKTQLEDNSWTADVNLKRGVRQGVPLSPVLFNMVLDRLLKELPEHIEYYIGTKKLNAIAFADDLTLFASTPDRLQTLINKTTQYLKWNGLVCNSAKCLSVSIKARPKQKKTIIEDRTFMVERRSIPAIKRVEEWKYLAIKFSPEGRTKYSPQEELQPMLEKIRNAPLKSQQRLHALRCFLIAKLYHKLTLSNIKIGCLRKTDRKRSKKLAGPPPRYTNRIYPCTCGPRWLGYPNVAMGGSTKKA